jgi:metallo-beta-lactamase class B
MLPKDHKLNLPSVAQRGGENGAPGEPEPAPVRVFDNLYYLGQRHLTAWAVDTSAGIILIDTLDDEKEAATTIEGGMRTLGLDPQRIKYIFLSHGHPDTFGGARYLAEKYHAHVLMTDADYELAKTYKKPTPERDLVIVDGQKLKLGNETITLYVTPGHTLGTISALIPVTDHGKKHVVAFWGGSGFHAEWASERYQTFAQSAQHFGQMAAAAGADIPLADHPELDGVIAKLASLKQAGGNGANPFIMGTQAVQRYVTTYSECGQMSAALVASKGTAH